MEFLRLLESIRTPFLDAVFGLITRLGEETVAIAVMCAIFWCFCKRIAYGIGIAYFLSGLTVQSMKIIFRIEEKYLTDCLKAAGAAVGFSVGMFIEKVYIKFSVKSKNILIQAVKFILGIAGVLAVKEGLKLAVGTELIVDTIRYFLMIVWIAVFFPLIIKNFFTAPNK